jgi:hypothetical protein
MAALLSSYLRAAAMKPFLWGQHDCGTFVLGWAELLTGRAAEMLPLPKSCMAYQRLIVANEVIALADALLLPMGFRRENLTGVHHGDIVLTSGFAFTIADGRRLFGLSNPGGLAAVSKACAAGGWLWRATSRSGHDR